MEVCRAVCTMQREVLLDDVQVRRDLEQPVLVGPCQGALGQGQAQGLRRRDRSALEVARVTRVNTFECCHLARRERHELEALASPGQLAPGVSGLKDRLRPVHAR